VEALCRHPDLSDYVRGQRVLTLPEAVRKMTSLPAQILGLADRGQIKAGRAGRYVGKAASADATAR
jgi:N-acyl-D-aspartate/D-glutamate deacylase